MVWLETKPEAFGRTVFQRHGFHLCAWPVKDMLHRIQGEDRGICFRPSVTVKRDLGPSIQFRKTCLRAQSQCLGAAERTPLVWGYVHLGYVRLGYSSSKES